MVWNVYQSPFLNAELRSFPSEFILWVEHIKNQLADNPYVGKPLRTSWFREKKYGKYRIIYLIYKDLKSVYLIHVCDKKNQQHIINTTWSSLAFYREEIEKLASNERV
jgi:mRNA-degrading endonuclease RelE of RelBE toxin-antitoxin system